MNKFKYRGVSFEDHVYGECHCESCPINFSATSEVPLGSVVWMKDEAGGFYHSYGHWMSKEKACDVMISRYRIFPRPNSRWVGVMYDGK